jgi:hypothetical protein
MNYRHNSKLAVIPLFLSANLKPFYFLKLMEYKLYIILCQSTVGRRFVDSALQILFVIVICNSPAMRVILFKSYCMCLYSTALWRRFNEGTVKKLHSCYCKCKNMFFVFRRRNSISIIQSLLALPSPDTVLVNGVFSLKRQMSACHNLLVKHLVLIFAFDVQ